MEEWIKGIIQNEVYCEQGALIERCFTYEIFRPEDIENNEKIMYKTPDNEVFEELAEAKAWCEENELNIEGIEEYYEPEEIFQYFSISQWLCDQLKELCYPVIDNEYGCWMCRTTFGQALYMDYIWKQLYEEIFNSYH